MRFALCGLAAVLAFGLGLCLVSVWFGRSKKTSFMGQVSADDGLFGRPENSSVQLNAQLAHLMRHGVRVLAPLGEVLLGFSFVLKTVECATAYLKEKGVVTTPIALTTLLLAVMVLLAGASFLLTGTVVAGLAVGACVLAFVTLKLGSIEDKRAVAMRYAVPDAFRSMESCFQAGFSLLQTLQLVAEESTGPLKAVFSRAAHRLEMGGSVEDALAEIQREASVPELAFAAVALDVQHQAGGSLKQVLEAARESVEGQIALQRALRVQTAQAKLSARVVSVMPFVLLALFSVVSVGFLDPFFESIQGFALLAIAFGMQGAGILAVRKMLAVEVV